MTEPNHTPRTHASADESASNDGAEISFFDILLFLKGAWKMIVMMGLAGLVISGIYLLITPNQYEAVANIAMARVPADNNPLGVNIEEPTALIARMSVPTSFDGIVIQACGLEGATNIGAQQTKVIKLSIPKGVANVVELKVTRPSTELASSCAKSVYESIAKSQAQMIGPMTEASKARNSVRLSKVEDRLAQDKVLLAKAEQPRGVFSPMYFSVLTEIRALEGERETLLALVEAKDVQTANLQSPIYVADKPVYPKKMMSLVAGLMGGLFLGLLIALGRQMYVKLKSEAGGAL